jgi:uroporphyrin-III C-methyltransferase/precorrin-2 dehydrogenase/sirohydrochlorin ferrochelatase/uroporphyrin-III C-methyltransferase
MPASTSLPPQVVIIGAGPGDPELLTLKAIRHLQRADVVLTDRLVNPTIAELFAPQAVIIPVGKQCRRQQSTPQASINQLMVHHAQAGRYVVRLKGGDINVFGNMLDELQALHAHHIRYELVPGISAAMGVAAATGVPLTARGYSKGIRLLTYYNRNVFAPADWQNLATTTDTLVFYMSGETCFELAAQLIAYGKPATTPILLAEQATTPLQSFHLSTLGSCSQQWKAHRFLSPALLIIGEVAALHQQFSWAPYQANPEEFFAPLRKSVVPPVTPIALQSTIH